MKSNKLFLVGIVFLSAFLIMPSCKKHKDTIAKVYIQDEQKNAVASCRVILKPEPSQNSGGKALIDADTAYTNLDGEAIFNYNHLYQLGQAGVAVLNIEASKDVLSGTGIIQIKEETTSEATVFIN